MPIMPPFTRKKPAPGAPAATPEEVAEGEEDMMSESPSDIDAPKKTGGKPNPLMRWAQVRSQQ